MLVVLAEFLVQVEEEEEGTKEVEVTVPQKLVKMVHLH